MPQNAHTVPGSEYGLSLSTVAQFAVAYPKLYPTEHSLRWLIWARSRNGLLDYGATVEVWSQGDQRPQIYIHAPSWFAWMQAGGSRAPRRVTRNVAAGGAP